MAGTPEEEIRFAVVLNGGVSLAVWMGGVVLELDRLTRSDGVYKGLLEVLRCSARADVITGTSAGGINGAALALSQVNENARLSSLRDLWVEQGRFEELLRKPFHGQPASLLQGDEFFLPRLKTAFEQLTREFAPRPADQRPIDLRITTTLLNGVPKKTYDDLGQPLTQMIHQGSFTFRRDPDKSARDDFTKEESGKLVEKLALAARSTASFPFAFEPSFVPVGGTGEQEQPDMSGVAGWSKVKTDRSRFAVDGGVLVNTPTKEALEAIDRLPADDPVRRVMLLVFPHAPAEGMEPKPDTTATAPTVVGMGGRLLSAMYSQSGRTYVEKIEEHNRAAVSRRGGRNDLLNQLAADQPVVAKVYQLATTLYGHYQDMRIRQVACEVTTKHFETRGAQTGGWSFERTRRAAEAAQRDWLKKHSCLPYVPVEPPAVRGQGAGPGWPWGFAMAESLASATLDLLKRMVWAVSPGEDLKKIKSARTALHESRCKIQSLHAEFDPSCPEAKAPDSRFWMDRLRTFEQEMVRSPASKGARVRAEVMKIGAIVDDVQQLLADIDEGCLVRTGLGAWKELLADDFIADNERALGWSGDEHRAERWISRLLALEISTTCLADTPPGALDQPVELVQVSLQTQNAFAEYSKSPDDKAGGASLGRFSGFLKRSWRVNDWIWGRLDAATMLCQVLFDPELLRRQDALAPREGRLALHRAQAFMCELVDRLFGGSPADAKLQELIGTATEELIRIYSAESDVDCEPTAKALAELAAWALHIRIIVEELPALRSAILADAADGANPRSHGELFLAEHEQLLRDAAGLGDFTHDPVTYVHKGIQALKAFDKAGIGREPLADEASSDHMIRTAVTAAAVAATVLDSDKSGLKVAKPVTRAVRGGALLPYWMVTGLTKGGRTARGMALFAGTLGIAMLVLAMFALLPQWAIAPAATTGTGLVLTIFGYSALRSGTMLHGMVLLTPVVPLCAHAIDRWTMPGGEVDRSEAATAVVSLGGIVAGAAFLILLGSLPAVRQTPMALVVDKWRYILGVVVLLAGVWGVVSLGVVPAIVALVRQVSWDHWWLLGFGVLAMIIAFWQGRRLKGWQPDAERRKPWWERAEHPAAVTAGWAAVYSLVLLAAALSLGQWSLPESLDQRQWMTDSAVAVTLAFGFVLSLVTSWFVPWRARRKLRGKVS